MVAPALAVAEITTEMRVFLPCTHAATDGLINRLFMKGMKR
jgi:hypothetical protein